MNMDGSNRGDMKNIEFSYTMGMSDDEVENRLLDESIAVLSLAKNGESYAIPVAFHYEDGRIYVRLGVFRDSEKIQMLEATRTACFLVYDADPLESSWSIIAQGPIERVDTDAEFDDERLNSWFVPLRIFGESIEEIDPTVFVIDVESMTGRRSTTD